MEFPLALHGICLITGKGLLKLLKTLLIFKEKFKLTHDGGFTGKVIRQDNVLKWTNSHPCGQEVVGTWFWQEPFSGEAPGTG